MDPEPAQSLPTPPATAALPTSPTSPPASPPTLAPEHEPIAIQRWSLERLALTLRTVGVAVALLVLLAVNLANPRTP